MHRIMPTMRSVLLGAAAAAVFFTTTYGQSILGPPSEANHFIETPNGWVHPKTPVGRAGPPGDAEHDAVGERAARALRQQLPASAARPAT